MIGSFIFLCAIIGIMVVIAWCIKNEKLGVSGKTTGLLAMKEADENAAEPQEKKPRTYGG